MSALTIRMSDEKYQRLKALSRHRKMSVNRLIDEMATQLLAEFDAQTRFQLRAARGGGQTERGLALLARASGGPESMAGPMTPMSPHDPEVAVAAPIAQRLASAPVSLLALVSSAPGRWGADSARTLAELRDEWGSALG